MCLKIRCDGKSEKFCKIFWELNKALVLNGGGESNPTIPIDEIRIMVVSPTHARGI